MLLLLYPCSQQRAGQGSADALHKDCDYHD